MQKWESWVSLLALDEGCCSIRSPAVQERQLQGRFAHRTSHTLAIQTLSSHS